MGDLEGLRLREGPLAMEPERSEGVGTRDLLLQARESLEILN